MAVKVIVPTPLQRLTQGKEEIDVLPGSVIDLVWYLDSVYPGIAARISSEGKIRRFVNIYVNDKDIRSLDAEATMTSDGDEVSIVPAIAGGVYFMNIVII